MNLHVPAAIDTRRLLLRQLAPGDFNDHAEISSDPGVMKYVGRGGALTRDDAWHSLAWLLGHWQLAGAGAWAVCERDTGRFIGRAGFIAAPDWPGLELAWLLKRDAWGQGYAFEACTAILDGCQGWLAGKELISLIHPDNQRSIRLARRLGAEPAGTTAFMGAELLKFVHGRRERDDLAHPRDRLHRGRG